MNPEGEFSKEEEVLDEPEQVIEHKKGVTFGPALIVLLSVVCLAVVFWFIYTIWSTPEPTPPVVEEEVEIEAETAPVDITLVPGRNPEILGLRIDTVIGRFFTIPESGQTLYVNTGECDDECAEDWEPYLTETAIEGEANIGTMVITDGDSLQYTWKGQPLYTYKMDNDRSVLGDGYQGTWRIARP